MSTRIPKHKQESKNGFERKEISTGSNQVRDIINISKCKNTDHAEVVFRDRRFGVTKSIESNLTISDFDDILPNNFHRIDRSNIINLDFVVFYDSTYVVVERYTDQCAFIHKNSITQKMIEL